MFEQFQAILQKSFSVGRGHRMLEQVYAGRQVNCWVKEKKRKKNITPKFYARTSFAVWSNSIHVERTRSFQTIKRTIIRPEKAGSLPTRSLPNKFKKMEQASSFQLTVMSFRKATMINRPLSQFSQRLLTPTSVGFHLEKGSTWTNQKSLRVISEASALEVILMHGYGRCIWISPPVPNLHTKIWRMH